MRVYVMMGLPGSGKSVKAREIVDSMPNCVIISGDGIRGMLKGEGRYFYEAALGERLVYAMLERGLQEAVSSLHDVVIDETNHLYRVRKRWYEIIDLWGTRGSIICPKKPEINLYVMQNCNIEELAIRRAVNGHGLNYGLQHWQAGISRMAGEWEDPVDYEYANKEEVKVVRF